MNIIKKLLFSTRAMAVMLLIYAVAMAVATFIENDYGTPAAKQLVYYSVWFSVLQVLLIINFIANIFRYRLWHRGKWSVLLFHVAFVVMFIGAAYTHLFSVEGMMNIREGETSNHIISNKTYVKLDIFDGDQHLAYETPYTMTFLNSKKVGFPLHRNFSQRYLFKDRDISVRSLDYIPHAKDTVIAGKGKLSLEIVTVGQGGRKTNYIQEGEIKEIGGAIFTFNNPIEGTIQISGNENALTINSPLEGQSMSMQGQQMGAVTDSATFAQSLQKIEVNTPQNARLRAMYQIGPVNFVLAKPAYRGTLEFIAGDKNKDQENSNVVVLEYKDGNVKDTLILRGGEGYTNLSARKQINGLMISAGYGSKIINTPFAIKLKDFQMETYPGSQNPSSFASEIAVIDNGKEKDYRIYMNNVLDYGGYRFFQSGYDPDQLGTRLSVNQDRPGTIITYIGYFMLYLGMFLTLFWKGSRFTNLAKMLKNLSHKKYLFLGFLSVLSLQNLKAQDAERHIRTLDSIANSAEAEQHHEHDGHNHGSDEFAMKADNITTIEKGEDIVKQIHFSPEHLDKFEHLLIQDDRGRIKPVSTHALELLRKVYKSDKFYGLPATAWFISVQQNPSLWAKAPIIKVGKDIGPELYKKLKVDETNHTSLMNMVNLGTGEFYLAKAYGESFRKKPSEKTKQDNEIINVTERFTILDNLAKGYYLKMIPVQNDINETWTSWIKQGETMDIDTTALAFFNKYFNAVNQAQKNNDWAQANSVVDEIGAYQQKWGKNIVPPQTKVNIEVFYNHFEPFFHVMKVYGVLGIIFLILGFMNLFSNKKILRKLIFYTLIATWAVFMVHAFGLGLRWYISGHAPWTNGYEAIVFISWIGVLAGLILYRNSNAFLPAAGCFVAVIMMGFAHGSALLDPQITPLVPVLKSYWLIIHVAIIAASYGFFGLGMVLAIFSLVLYCLKPSKIITKNIKELTIVNEMSLTIGIFLLTVGTFLGGMWANESWGRYWSWDPKETWAFISIIVYAFVLHMRLVPGLRGNFAFNIASLWAVASPIMTYFGVNYYLSGLHTYAAGDKIPIPTWVPISVAIALVLSLVSYYFYRKNHKKLVSQ